LIGSLNSYSTAKGELTYRSNAKERFKTIEKFIEVLLSYIHNISDDEEKKMLTLLGSGADTKWLRFFQTIIHNNFPDYNPVELEDWRERQDEQLQDEGRKYGVVIEKRMKRLVLDKIQTIYKENWELEINSIKRECLKRAEEENERNYKEGLSKKNVVWTEMFNINDYKTIVEKYWTTKPDEVVEKLSFRTFEDDFSIDAGLGFHKKTDKTKWISYFNAHRNLWAHEGTKEKRLNREEVNFLHLIHKHFENLIESYK
jgi:DNA sulfur modification protein DndB